MGTETKKLDARRQRVAGIAESASLAFKDHLIEQRLNQGLYRSWRCQRPGSWTYGFDVTTIPGSIIVTGDIGELIVQRVPDMVEFCRTSIKDIDYFRQKVPSAISTLEWDQDIAIEWLNEQIAEGADLGYDASDIETLGELRDGLDDFNSYDVFGKELYESGVLAGSDFPDLKNYTAEFLWCREALKWFIAHLPTQ